MIAWPGPEAALLKEKLPEAGSFNGLSALFHFTPPPNSPVSFGFVRKSEEERELTHRASISARHCAGD